MKDEYDRLVKSARYSRISQISAVSLLCLGIGSSLYIGVTGRTNEVVKVLIPMALGLGVIGTASGIVANQSEEVLKDWTSISDQQTTNRVYQQLEPATVALPKAKVYYFQWEVLKAQRDNYPHIQIVNKSGGGKSTLAEYLCSLLGGVNIAVAPHYQIGDYPTATALIGAGRNLGEGIPEGMPRYTLEHVVTDGQQMSVTEFLQLVSEEMNIRYQLTSEGLRKGGDEVNIIWDEYPSYADLRGVAKEMLKLMREVRKVGVRNIIITQSDLCGAIGMSERDKRNLTTIRLNADAIDHAKSLLASCRPGTEDYEKAYEVYEAVAAMTRPCMVDNSPAIIPEVVRE